MDNLLQYYQAVTERFGLILAEERENIEKAAELISDSLREPENLLHIFGTGGHSIMAAEELFYRAGGLYQIDPIFFAGVSQINGGLKTELERVPGIAAIIMKPYHFKEKEVMIVSSQVGINALTIEAAEESKKRGLYVVAVEGRELCDAIPKDCVSRHPSGQNLHDIADVTIDAKIPYGDAVIEVPGAMNKTGPVSNLLIFFVLHLIIIRTVEKLIQKGANPPIVMSGNIPGGDEANRRYIGKYVRLVKAL
jgi:uncharacterized phosphosugar-binding protein